MGAAADFRARHGRGRLFVLPTPWDVGTARFLVHAGFEAVASASAALATSLGRPDGCNAVPRATAIAHARTLVEAVDVPVNGDLENGFGDAPQAAAETVAEAIKAGLAGCSIEDTTGDARRPLYDRAHAVERIAAAAAARDAADPDFVLTARCEAYLTGHDDPLAECLARLPVMAAAGADVVYACGMHRPDDIRALVGAVEVPVNVLGGSGPTPLALDELAELGVTRVSLGPRLMQAAMGGFLAAVDELRSRGTFDFMARAGDLRRLQRPGG
jgi:2-methylisocitrate lyase-like PEP mutase family enzyme